MSSSFLRGLDQTRPFVARRNRREPVRLAKLAEQRLQAVLGKIIVSTNFGNQFLSGAAIDGLVELAKKMDQFPYLNPDVLGYSLVYYDTYLRSGDNPLTLESMTSYITNLYKDIGRRSELDYKVIILRLYEEMIRYVIAIMRSAGTISYLTLPPPGEPVPEIPEPPEGRPQVSSGGDPQGIPSGEIHLVNLNQPPSTITAITTHVDPREQGEPLGEASWQELAGMAQELNQTN